MVLRHLVLGLVFALAACGGSSSVETPATQSLAYTLPATPGGRMCVNQCNQARDFCQQTCDYDIRSCYYEIQKAAQRDYDTYMRDQFARHAPAIMLPSDFEHPEACMDVKKNCLAECDGPYNECYRGCGGVVSTTSSCQYLCFK
jgi:hypothetical protein